jgi:hypothetical protein
MEKVVLHGKKSQNIKRNKLLLFAIYCMEVGLFCFFLKSKIENKIAAVNNVGDIRN